MREADVLIIGGGGAGTSAALHLALRGVRVILLERGLIGSQATGVNYGGVRQQGRDPRGLPLAIKSREIWSRMAALTGGDAEFDPCGHLKLARTAAEEEALLAWNAQAAAFGLRPRMIGRNAIRAQHPYFSDVIVAGSLMEEDGSANPRLLAPLIGRAAKAAGASLREHHRVTRLSHDGSRFRVQAETPDGAQDFAAPWLLNCAGFWGAELARQFGEHAPVGKLHPNMLVTEPLPYFLRNSLGVVGGDLYLRQIPRGNVIFGGGRGESDEAITWTRPRPDDAFGAMGRAIAAIPQLRDAMIIRSWTGTDGETPDHLPIIGPSRTTPGLLHAFALCGEGFQTGPGIGAVLSELVMDGRTDIPIAAFDIGRFAGQDAPAQ